MDVELTNAGRRDKQATGQVVERWTGAVMVRVAGKTVGDHVVFAEPGDLTLLGSRSLEGLNLMVDPIFGCRKLSTSQL